MKQKCARCGKEREGNAYEVRIKLPNGEDLKSTAAFLCNSCAKSGFAPVYWFGIFCVGGIGLGALGGGVNEMLANGFGSGALAVLIGLAFLVGAGFIFKSLVWDKPASGSGLFAAGKVVARTLTEGGYDAVAGTMPGVVVLRSAQGIPAQAFATAAPAPARSSAPSNDMAAIRAYTHSLAVQWWDQQGVASAICDVCNGGVSRGQGHLVGSWLYCDDCGAEKLGDAALVHLRSNPDFFGRGLLEKAREFARNAQPA